MNRLILIAAISVVLAGPTHAGVNAYDDFGAKNDENYYLAGDRPPDETHTLPSGGIVRIWHTDKANFFGLPPIPMPRLTCITITDKEQRVKASLYIKDGVSAWLPGEQYLLMLRNIGEATLHSETGWWFNSATASIGQGHAQWRKYQDGTKHPAIDKIHLLVEVNEDPGRVYMIFVNADNGGLDVLKESGYYSGTVRQPLDK